MSDLATNASLIVATMDLKVVQLIRGAMRAADRGALSLCGSWRCPAATFVERPRRIHPEPRIEPRRVIRQTPLIEPRWERPTCPDILPLDGAFAPQCSPITPSPIQPPWKTLPWQNSPPPAKVIKVVMRRPDNLSKGSIIDCFL